MRIRVVDIDIHHLTRIDGLSSYDGVEILFRAGREPLGSARIRSECDFLDPEDIRPLIEDLPLPSPLDVPVEAFPTVTVAICTRERPTELAAALISITQQEHQPDEILVIDNGCQEEVREVVERILPAARYLPERRSGLNFARNRALSEATSDIIAFLDDDTVADPFWVQSLAECFAAFPETGAVTGLILPLELETDAQKLFEANGGYSRGFTRRILPKDGKRFFGMPLPLLVEALSLGSGCNMAFKTTVLRKLHGFDEALDAGPPLPGGGDLDIFYRVLRTGCQFVYEPRALIRHRHRRSREALRRQLAGHYRSVSAFFVKTLCSEPSFARIKVALFLAWRITKSGYRLIRSLVGCDSLPITFNAHIFAASLAGLGSYHASKWRIRGQTG